ncbi:hypothetical protein RclHR1_12800016 [Rhizophagus clarus]|nr:hypothetical protein RclHR1_12800016 [Rhizophagus clarus]
MDSHEYFDKYENSQYGMTSHVYDRYDFKLNALSTYTDEHHERFFKLQTTSKDVTSFVRVRIPSHIDDTFIQHLSPDRRKAINMVSFPNLMQQRHQ